MVILGSSYIKYQLTRRKISSGQWQGPVILLKKRLGKKLLHTQHLKAFPALSQGFSPTS